MIKPPLETSILKTTLTKHHYKNVSIAQQVWMMTHPLSTSIMQSETVSDFELKAD